MEIQIGIILVVMVLAYALAKWRKLSIELSMLFAAVAGGVVGAAYSTPPPAQLIRHLVEGSFTYLDVILVFSTATIFMAIVSESGGVNYVVRSTIKHFYKCLIPICRYIIPVTPLCQCRIEKFQTLNVLKLFKPSR